MSTPKELQRVELLNYTKANGDELVGLAVELAEDPSGGVQVRVLMDANVVSGVTVVPLPVSYTHLTLPTILLV